VVVFLDAKASKTKLAHCASLRSLLG